MKKDEFRRLVLQRLDELDEQERERLCREQPGSDDFVELHRRWQSARGAWPDMSWDEFIEEDKQRQRRGQRGRKPIHAGERADDPMFRAAHDVDRIKDIWRSIAPDEKEPPVPPSEIAAERHGVDEAALGDLIRRPNSRRHDRKARRP